MKRILLMLSILVFAAEVQAVPISVSSGETAFETHDGILQSDVDAAERLLRVYMEDSLSCSKVRMNLNILKQPGFFSDGRFVLDLSADCDASVRGLRFDFDPSCSEVNEGDAALVVEYLKQGQLITKRFIVRNSASCRE